MMSFDASIDVAIPSGRLPTELLSEIFLHCVDGVIDISNTITIPLLLSKICSRWRDAAISTPRLWSRLFLQLATPADSQVDLVKTWLTRSGGCPLTIYVFWEEPPFLPSHPVLNALMEQSVRWQVVFCYLPSVAFPSLSRVRNRLPLLTELSLGTDDDLPLTANGTLNMFEVAPRLTQIECVNFAPTIFNFPWSQLSVIPIMAVSIEDSVDILRQATNLEQGGFIFVGGGNQRHPLRNWKVQHNRLRYFTIMTPPWNETIDLRRLFSQLTFPFLENLTICNLKSPFSAEFVQFLSRLKSLRTLHLRKTAIVDHQLVQGLKHLPSLTSLIVHSSPQDAPTVTGILLAALTWKFFSDDSKGLMLVPKLKKLELTINRNVAQQFIDMVESRVIVNDEIGGNPARLEMIRVRPTEELGEEILCQLVLLREWGPSIAIEDLEKGITTI